ACWLAGSAREPELIPPGPGRVHYPWCDVVRIALGQINTTAGNLDGNGATMAEWSARARAAGADLVCFPELAVTGYPPEDLVLRPEFVRDNLSALEELASETAGACPVLVGFVDRTESGL